MKTYFTALCCCLIAICSYAQDNCTCTQDLEFVIGYYERNLPGFKDNVTPDTEATYATLKQDLLQASSDTQNKSNCFKLLVYYVEYFRDNHSKIIMSVPHIDETDATSLEAFFASEIYKARERYELQASDLKQYPMDDIRGMYQTADSTYTIAIIPNKGTLRDYIGVIVNAKTALWEKGQVKMELKSKPDGGFEAFVYMRNHSLYYYPDFKLRAGILGDSWFKQSKKERVNHSLKQRAFDFKILQDSIAYLQIPTFSGDYSAMIDSVYKATATQIQNTPYLIIDVRNNGGGSDSNAAPLLDYIYTNPIQGDKVSLYVTEDNIKMWERWYKEIQQDPENYGKEDLKWFKREIKRMKRAKLNTFITRSKGKLHKQKLNPKRPKKVAIIQNKNCASSCETLLFWAKQSSNTILVGENSGGYVGYGEVGEVQTPCYQYTLYCTMTRYEAQRKYEVIGVAPEHYLDMDEDWVTQSIELLLK